MEKTFPVPSGGYDQLLIRYNLWTEDKLSPTFDRFEVYVNDLSDSKMFKVCSGVTSAKAGKMCSLYVRVRGEADVDEPDEPPVAEEP